MLQQWPQWQMWCEHFSRMFSAACFIYVGRLFICWEMCRKIYISNEFNLIIVKYSSKQVECGDDAERMMIMHSATDFNCFPFVCIFCSHSFASRGIASFLIAPRFPARYIESVHACIRYSYAMCVQYVQFHWLVQHVATERTVARKWKHHFHSAIKIKSKLCICVFYLCLCYFNFARCVRCAAVWAGAGVYMLHSLLWDIETGQAAYSS